MTDEKTTCPYCKEDIKADAIKCKHCHSMLAENRPAHEGVCPFCKEAINPEAIKCKHCKSSLLKEKSTGCGCSSRLLTELSSDEDNVEFTNTLLQPSFSSVGNRLGTSRIASRRRGGRGPGSGDGICWYYSCGTCSDGSVMLCTDVIGCPPDLCTDISLPQFAPTRGSVFAR